MIKGVERAVRLLVAGLRSCYSTGDNSRWCRRCLDRVVRDKRRPALCVKGEQKGSVKAGGFGFVSFGKEKTEEAGGLFSLSVESLLNKGDRKKVWLENREKKKHGVTLWRWSSIGWLWM
ncbi:hypothetical protein Hdeb2414_s0007g00238061 [Helianthus debilis subsp. tardiflorus]